MAANEHIPIAYILTDYPRVAMTFIAGEIDAIEAQGLGVLPIAMNWPSPRDLAAPDDRQRHARTVYLKAAPARVLASLLACLLRHPLGMARLLSTAIRSAGTDVGQIARRLAHLAYATHVARVCEERGVRHLHAHFGMAPATIAWFAAELLALRRKSAPSWSFTVHGPHDFFDQAVARIDLKAVSASFIAVISDFARSQVYRIIDPAHWHKVEIVRCGVDLGRLPPRAARPFGAPPRIVTVGRIAPEKGHAVLLQALRILADRGIAATLEIVGGGPFEAEVRDQAARLGVADRTVFAGELQPAMVAERLEAADIFCMASFAEGLPISIMEAMAVGVPVVTTWISGIPELAVDGVTALTVPPGNAERLADALGRVIADAALRENLVRAARVKVARLHSRADSGARLAGLFAAVAALPHPRAVETALPAPPPPS